MATRPSMTLQKSPFLKVTVSGKFLTVEGSENLETEGGYAKEASDDFKKKTRRTLI